ncbi:cytochrome c oxidase assembly protein [Planctomicrobium sp. SH664]|uniref:cytochrome c oxidase assembly protein n=1 Tax=Planctomicrobium sp. SH664 TaxID=3448125 RepID=UPI003F5BE4F1
MNSVFDAFVRSWPSAPWFVAGLLLCMTVYVRGWRVLRVQSPQNWGWGNLFAFAGGLFALFLAIASPIDPFAELLLQVHMLQHLLLMMVAPPLLWLGAPLFPLLRGLPRSLRRHCVSPCLQLRSLRNFMERLTRPWVALPIFVLTTWLWHLPPVYDAALRNPAWHHLQHLYFLLAGLLFWYPVVRPYPAAPRWSTWWLIPYLILADVQNTVLSALLTFSDRFLFPHYESVPRFAGITALGDQSAAGVLMWVPGSIAFLGPLLWIGTKLFFAADSPRKTTRRLSPAPTGIFSGIDRATGLSPQHRPVKRFDLLRVPVIGTFLRWRWGRRLAQGTLFLLAVLIVVDGLCGPQLGAMNLAGVLPWIHWRGILIFLLLVAGNFLCFACPLTLPLQLLGRWLPQGARFPQFVRNKWITVVLLILFLWAYEAFSLWDRPGVTALVIVALFTAAFAIDTLFRAGSFCKYVCPIGQFNFVQALVSPLSVSARNPAVCANCVTRECITGRDSQPGCDLQLFVPMKQGNLDCTFCLDCVKACPADNVAIVPLSPVTGLVSDGERTGIGRFSQRGDLAALMAVLCCGAFANAAGMVAPVVGVLKSVSRAWQLESLLLPVTLFNVLALLGMPLAAGLMCGWFSRHWGKLKIPPLTLARRFAVAFVPLGFAMWSAHYSFHFLTSWQSVVPVVQRFAADWGWIPLGEPLWRCACCQLPANWLICLEILALDLGLLASLYAVWRISSTLTAERRLIASIAIPWATLGTLLFAVGVWLVFQPMEMRGTLTSNLAVAGKARILNRLPQPAPSAGDHRLREF